MIPTQDLLFFTLLIVSCIVLFPVPCKNVVIAIFKRREYVVCHVFRTSTRKLVTIFAVPDSKAEYQTRIWKKKTYNLKPDKANFEDNGRLHYIFLEESNVPLTTKIIPITKGDIVFTYNGKLYLNTDDMVKGLKFSPWTNNETLIFSDEIDQALNAKSHTILHGSVTPYSLILAGLAVVIAIVAFYYSYSQVQEISPLVQVIYEKVAPGNISVGLKP